MKHESLLNESEKKAASLLHEVYPYRITNHLEKLITSTKDIGLRKQFIPQQNELQYYEKEYKDVCEEQNSDFFGVIQKYPNKVLLMLTYECFGNCRFCFRRGIDEYPKISKENFIRSLKYITDNNINEVILSGGDPLILKHSLLIDYIRQISQIQSVSIIRIHTRALTFNPNQISEELLMDLSKIETIIFFVFHINQYEEMSREFAEKTKQIRKYGFLMFSQTALLKGVNDTREKLQDLFENLLLLGVKPYYLFHTDPVSGIGHFRVSLKDGINLYKSIYNSISGLAIPIYLMNVPPGHGHVIIDLQNIFHIEGSKYLIKTWQGEEIEYYDI